MWPTQTDTQIAGSPGLMTIVFKAEQGQLRCLNNPERSQERDHKREITRESEVDHYVDAEITLLTVISPHTLHANQHMLCRQHNHYRMYSWSSATEH